LICSEQSWVSIFLGQSLARQNKICGGIQNSSARTSVRMWTCKTCSTETLTAPTTRFHKFSQNRRRSKCSGNSRMSKQKSCFGTRTGSRLSENYFLIGSRNDWHHAGAGTFGFTRRSTIWNSQDREKFLAQSISNTDNVSILAEALVN